MLSSEDDQAEVELPMAPNITDVLEDFLTYQLAMESYVASTASAVRSDVRGFLRFLEARDITPDLSAFSVRVLGDYFASQRRRVAGNTLKRWRKSFCALARWAVDREILSRNPVDSIKLGHIPIGRREFMFEHEEARRFLSARAKTGLRSEVDLVFRNLALFGGLRRNELIKLRWRHVNLATDEMSIYDSKATRRKGNVDNLDRVIPICPPLRNSLLLLSDTLRPNLEDPVLFIREDELLLRISAKSTICFGSNRPRVSAEADHL